MKLMLKEILQLWHGLQGPILFQVPEQGTIRKMDENQIWI